MLDEEVSDDILTTFIAQYSDSRFKIQSLYCHVYKEKYFSVQWNPFSDVHTQMLVNMLLHPHEECVWGLVTNRSRREWKENRQRYLVNKIVFIIENLNIKSRHRRFSSSTRKRKKVATIKNTTTEQKTPHHEDALPGSHKLTLSLATASFTAAEAHGPTLLT